MEGYQKVSIRQWAVEDRPREKLLHKGISSLSDAELLAILIGSGSQKESAVDLSRKILRDVNNNLNELGKMSIESMCKKYHGIGQAKAITIVAALELGRRRQLSSPLQKPQIRASEDVFSLMHPLLADLPHEEFWVLLLNQANKVMQKLNISKGGISGTVIDVRLIMEKALYQHASAIILCHNHPSGNRNPSKADINITKKLIEAGKILDISVLDHVIIAENCYFSFADEGMLQQS
ncbi:RadC family protein [Thermophagus xiamenensis]|jgi:DNA repair protein RadC|uniref:DNA repair protein RadC n=1 Tax=Thermophagus xiamenensis TaxID=385682 RepID=A0A1I1WVQ3_9BACT|nr:DNA repair protein RadC [Thermophagus xiamenensis]SFD99275.1 DNA repair protein RadC [Thermophagus xiamenensis]